MLLAAAALLMHVQSIYDDLMSGQMLCTALWQAILMHDLARLPQRPSLYPPDSSKLPLLVFRRCFSSPRQPCNDSRGI